MRRLVEEGVNNRFVTGDRLAAVLKVRLRFPRFSDRANF